ncbi:hypothetical protein BT63DRAFT_277577 [Microthyrium microscopicum]|uniref:Peptidase C14 caspase domain-containing protein n=1 Tax=Microthyrium microscopicum TaxID=703497 RepID=A0A6A6UBH5_9PEZI|nr:hypothetical protein BT63DRAFT_277577 [Microthyrium microscopicum]
MRHIEMNSTFKGYLTLREYNQSKPHMTRYISLSRYSSLQRSGIDRAQTWQNNTYMASMARPVVSLQGDGTPIESEAEFQKKQSHYNMMWEDNVMNNKRLIRYTKIVVLLLSWENSDIDRAEVEELKTVFKEEYQFVVVQRLIGNDKPQQKINRHVAEFVDDHDDDDTLLIFYYGGHGWYSEPCGDTENRKGLTLHRERTVRALRNAKTQSINWAITETLGRGLNGDVLAIFDCCDAGATFQTRGTPRFEYLAACPAGQLTRARGNGTFTKALIWALKELKTKPPGWFHTAQLRSQICKAPDFPKDQMPVLGEREVASFDRIVLAPMKFDFASTGDTVEPSISKSSKSRILDLRFHIDGSSDDIEALKTIASELHSLITIKHDELPAKRISFLQYTTCENLGANSEIVIIGPERAIIDYWKDRTTRRQKLAKDYAMRWRSHPCPASAENDATIQVFLPLSFTLQILVVGLLCSFIFRSLFKDVTIDRTASAIYNCSLFRH